MGNSLRTVSGNAPLCISTDDSSGLPSLWYPQRTSSIFSPLRMVQDEEGIANYGSFDPPKNPQRSTEELLADVKQSDAWKEMMQMYEPANSAALDEAEVDSGVDVEFDAEKLRPHSDDADGEVGAVDENTSKTNLRKLRQSTGYPFMLCKKALEESNNDLEKAEKWLEEEGKVLGIEKLKKIGNRKASEGLVGIAWDKQHAAMVEVNSETDFVSSNKNFRDLVNLVANTCLQHSKNTNPSPKSLSESKLKKDELGNLVADDKESLSDHLAKAVALMGERLILRRAALVSIEESARLAVMTHSSEPSEYKDQGNFGTMLVYKANDYNDQTLQLAKHLCHQIIGMNPKTVEASEGASKDEALMTQKYIHDPDLTVAEVTSRAGLKVEHFVRFERGEPGDNPDDLGSEPVKPLC